MPPTSSEPQVAISEKQLGFQAPMVVSEISDDCLYSGFFGRLDSARVKAITDKLLSSVSRTGIERVIVDLSNIDIIDSLVANHLLRIADTLKLVGVEIIFCGISSVVAQTMIATGVNIDRFKTVRNLKSALKLISSK